MEQREPTSRLPDDLIDAIEAIVGKDRVASDAADRWVYGYDNSRRHALPGAVAFPMSHDEVRALVTLFKEQRIPLTARGHGTCTTGAAVPAEGGIALSLERMNRILKVDPDNRLMVVEAGVTNQTVQEAAARAGFFWAPDPTSAAVCTVGGNIACNAAGPRAVKYGTTRDNVLGLRVVTGSGETMRTGTSTSKGVVGYDLTRLITGSEGTLAVVTEATLRLIPRPEAIRTLRAIYKDMESAALAVSRIMAQPVTPCALEFMDGRAIEMIRRYSRAQLPADAGSLLMIEVDGPAACVDDAARAVADAARGPGCMEVAGARTPDEVNSLWETRKALSPALRTVAPKKINEDVVVPVSRMPELINGLDALGQRHGITIVNFGHAGNGNIHVNLLVDPDDPRQLAGAEACLSDVFDLVLQLDGTLSGEHGIGLGKRRYVARELDAVAIDMMRRIKAQFDPNGILNPGKGLPEETDKDES